MQPSGLCCDDKTLHHLSTDIYNCLHPTSSYKICSPNKNANSLNFSIRSATYHKMLLLMVTLSPSNLAVKGRRTEYSKPYSSQGGKFPPTSSPASFAAQLSCMHGFYNDDTHAPHCLCCDEKNIYTIEIS